MLIAGKNMLDKLSDTAFIIYLALLYLFEFDTANVVLTYVAFVLYAGIVCYKIVIRKQWDFGIYMAFPLLFALFCTVSVLWADKPADATIKVNTLWQVFLLFLLVYHDFKHREDSDFLFKCMFTAGLILTAYTLALNGFSGMLEQMEEGERLQSETTNINTIGMKLSFTAIIGLYYIIFKRKFWIIPLIILPFIVSVATASKKVIIMYVIAIMMFAYIKGGSNFFVKLLKISVVVIVLLIIIRQFSDIPLFYTITERFESMFAIFGDDQSQADASTISRNNLMMNAFEIFKRNPIIGCGIGNFGYNNAWLLGGGYVYAHNNYLELLADVGVIGTFFYYAMYGQIIFGLIKGVKNKNLPQIMMFIVFAVQIIMEVALVAYYSKTTWVYLGAGYAMIAAKRSVNNAKQVN